MQFTHSQSIILLELPENDNVFQYIRIYSSLSRENTKYHSFLLGFYNNSCFTSGEELIHRLSSLRDQFASFTLVLYLWLVQQRSTSSYATTGIALKIFTKTQKSLPPPDRYLQKHFEGVNLLLERNIGKT